MKNILITFLTLSCVAPILATKQKTQKVVKNKEDDVFTNIKDLHFVGKSKPTRLQPARKCKKKSSYKESKSRQKAKNKKIITVADIQRIKYIPLIAPYITEQLEAFYQQEKNRKKR